MEEEVPLSHLTNLGYITTKSSVGCDAKLHSSDHFNHITKRAYFKRQVKEKKKKT